MATFSRKQLSRVTFDAFTKLTPNGCEGITVRLDGKEVGLIERVVEWHELHATSRQSVPKVVGYLWRPNYMINLSVDEQECKTLAGVRAAARTMVLSATSAVIVA